ncbi:MAG TPA: hypothetical protein VFR64_08725 [Methylomirabilota bacterium]|nr:hypothetical protein [Methylomirabilota bacterium]
MHLWYEPPQEIEIDRHFAQIETIVENFKPKRAVIDSLSTHGSSLGVAEPVTLASSPARLNAEASR